MLTSVAILPFYASVDNGSEKECKRLPKLEGAKVVCPKRQTPSTIHTSYSRANRRIKSLQHDLVLNITWRKRELVGLTISHVDVFYQPSNRKLQRESTNPVHPSPPKHLVMIRPNPDTRTAPHPTPCHLGGSSVIELNNLLVQRPRAR